MSKNQVKILHLRGTNGSQYSRVGLYSGGELPKEYRGVGKLFGAMPNAQELTLVSTNDDLDDGNTEEDVFKRVKERSEN